MFIFLRSRPGNIRLLKGLIIMDRGYTAIRWCVTSSSRVCERTKAPLAIDSRFLLPPLRYNKKKASYESSSRNYVPSDTYIKRSDFSRKKHDKITMTIVSKRHLSRIRETRTLLFYETLRNLNDRRRARRSRPFETLRYSEIKHQKRYSNRWGR